ncbi:hypothetical protein AK88_05653 [Plasmodium fragile]|uniref:Schizont-infected cell agglutination extracellular alpha domain-containing protein n=1 Tax=Plasmodium fragile TaxID=5857 RepID=A0A0D9QCE7_PLAFR|nr:uncharacterized protein AK88_05653 [Plasmodium fragile]KJP84715.1 hypothetical protein AK88_05653 [Plasmodium fragile]
MQSTLWKDITVLLDEFVEHLDDENLDQYAANCLNAGYWSESKQGILMAKKVADRLMCTLMTGALYFMNGWGTQSGGSHTTDPNNAALKEHIRCAIVNVFMYILLASKCRSQMGIDYAWHIVKDMEPGLGSGLINKNKCGQGVFEDIKIGELQMEKMIKKWLESKESLTDRFASPAIQSTCSKKPEELDGATPHANATDDNTELTQHEKDAIRELGRGMKTIVEEVKTGVMQCAEDNGACMTSIEAVTGRNREGDDSEGKATKSVASDKPAPNVAAGTDR